MKRSILAIAVAATVIACGKHRQNWVNADRIDKSVWGAACGSQISETVLDPGKPGLSYRTWLSGTEHAFGPDTIVRCSMYWENRSGKIYWLKVSANHLQRAQAETLLNSLILQYLPPDVKLAARDIAFTPVTQHDVRRDVGAFHIQGHWIEGTANELEVSLGEPPRTTK